MYLVRPRASATSSQKQRLFVNRSLHAGGRHMRGVLLGVGLAAAAATTHAQESVGSTAAQSAFLSWARHNAIPLPPVDQPNVDSSFAFLNPLVGSARILALGELIHGGHEPLEFRNQVIKYAVTRLGFTAVALETGFTEAAVVDGFIRGGAGNVDSVRHAGLTNTFDSLPENRELILWLRSYNAHAVHPIRFYGVDLSGGNDY